MAKSKSSDKSVRPHTGIAGLSNLRLALRDFVAERGTERRSTFTALLIDAAMNGNGTHTSTYTPVGHWPHDADLP
ncbi:MAG TPA: hypothetical protein VHV29_17935 [Terriglobales bacterium]|nr:hypothetical protein [Terriglobales bacterium]